MTSSRSAVIDNVLPKKDPIVNNIYQIKYLTVLNHWSNFQLLLLKDGRKGEREERRVKRREVETATYVVIMHKLILVQMIINIICHYTFSQRNRLISNFYVVKPFCCTDPALFFFLPLQCIMCSIVHQTRAFPHSLSNAVIFSFFLTRKK